MRTWISTPLATAAGLTLLATAAGVLAAAAPRVQQTAAAKPSVTVYKSPTCGCCSKWVDHMRANGFEVKALDVEDIEAVKRTYGVPEGIGSCHTSLVGGYVIEGHVPADAVARVLRERPKIAGIAVPGMPLGSPGMEQGPRKDPYSILSFEKTGKYSVYERR